MYVVGCEIKQTKNDKAVLSVILSVPWGREKKLEDERQGGVARRRRATTGERNEWCFELDRLNRLFCSKCGAAHMSQVGASVNARTGEQAGQGGEMTEGNNLTAKLVVFVIAKLYARGCRSMLGVLGVCAWAMIRNEIRSSWSQ